MVKLLLAGKQLIEWLCSLNSLLYVLGTIQSAAESDGL